MPTQQANPGNSLLKMLTDMPLQNIGNNIDYDKLMQVNQSQPPALIIPDEQQLAALRQWGTPSDLWQASEGKRWGAVENLGKFGLNTLLDFLPGIGDIKSAQEAITGTQPMLEGVPGIDNKLDLLGRITAGLGALPFIPNMAGVMKKAPLSFDGMVKSAGKNIEGKGGFNEMVKKARTGEANITTVEPGKPVGGVDFELYAPKKWEDSFYHPDMGKGGGYRVQGKSTTEWAMYNGDGELVRNDPSVSPEQLEKWNSAVKKAKTSHLNDLPNNIYFRFGNVPKGGTSKDYSSGKTEKGLSVYNAKKDLLTDTVWPDLNDGALPAAAIMRGAENAPVYLVTGRKVSIGTDGEPVIRNVSVIGKLKLHPDKNITGFTIDLPNPSRLPESGKK